jgi:hypothetical protein
LEELGLESRDSKSGGPFAASQTAESRAYPPEGDAARTTLGGFTGGNPL